LAEVEDTVNAWIVSDAPVTAETKSREEAVDEGAIALFGEKYGETVRVVKVPGVSAELCGGTHCSRTGEIGSFRITSEGSAAANVRRIEAVCGLVAIRRARERDALLGETARALNCAAEELPARVAALREQLAEAKRAAAKAAVTGAVDAGTLLASARSVGPARLVTHRLNAAAAEAAKTLVDDLVARGDGIVAVVASVDAEAQVMLFAKAADGLVAQGAHAGGLVKAVAAACGGRGGGKPTFAQAGGGDPERLDGALAQAAEVLAKQLGV
jgi:alanyl-tRNA synthetase